MRILETLIAARGNTVTTDALCAAMRKPGHPEVSTANLRVGLYRLRHALLEAGSLTRIESRLGYGWRLAKKEAVS